MVVTSTYCSFLSRLRRVTNIGVETNLKSESEIEFVRVVDGRVGAEL